MRLSVSRSVVVLAVALCACGGGHDGATVGERTIPPTGTADGFTIAFGSQPDPPSKGENSFVVSVTDQGGAPVTDAAVTAVFSMPAMRSESTLQHEGNGRYRGSGQLSMGGTWNVAITVSRASTELATRRLSIVAND